ncbi:hypothetical protein K1T71_004748 [Dendrolimus kikuchii]|uniref:Uncharacterized protein n=1 Tax=Dendrolimus kikuchii TaxID=765133 RepID=A0ACC1D9S5_9NEOP|nr:hypothetical protein K1T71_004748 [Dendrolimus kikuchii]
MSLITKFYNYHVLYNSSSVGYKNLIKCAKATRHYKTAHRHPIFHNEIHVFVVNISKLFFNKLRYEVLFIMILSIELYILCIISMAGSRQTFLYERMHNFGLGRRIIPNSRRLSFNRRYEYPEPLPTLKPSALDFVHSPYRQIYQGKRVHNDTRVFRRKFDFEPRNEGHNLYCEGTFDCPITHMAIETKEGVPIILRGGVGYRHFTVVIKAKPDDHLAGSIRAYCSGTRTKHNYA